MTLAATIVALSLTSCVTHDIYPEASDEVIELFDGQSLDGWHTLPGGTWTVEDGVIVGRSPASEQRHGLLVSDATYTDFELTVEFRILEGDSGLYFRVEKTGTSVGVNGFQAEIDNKEPGGLYETGGRAWVIKPRPEEVAQYYRPRDWNEMTVSAIGRNISVTVNGHLSAALVDDPGRTEGHIALQLHDRQKMHVEFRRVSVRPIAATLPDNR